MSTKTDFYVRRGTGAYWCGSVQWECEPYNLLATAPGRRALASTDEGIYRAAVEAVLVLWEAEGLGQAYPRSGGWPWPWNTSHVSSWIIAFDPDHDAVFVTVGGGVAWHRLDPRAPRLPKGSDPLGPPDIWAWLHDPAAPPSVPLPLMRDPATGAPTTRPDQA